MRNRKYNSATILVFDGLSPDFIQGHLDYLPNFRKLMIEGSFGKITSTIPPITISCVASFLTGASSKVTRVLDFREYDPKNLRKEELIFATRLPIPNIVDLSNYIGFSVGVFNVPFISPLPKPSKGFVVAGFPLSGKSNYAWPADLLEELRARKYSPETPQILPNSTDIIDKLLQGMKSRWEIFKELRKRYRPLISIAWLSETDHISHYFWHKEDIILRAYQCADRILGDALKQTEKGSLLIVASDHGFMEHKSTFLINSYLRDRDLLRLKKGPLTAFKLLLTKIGMSLRQKSTLLGAITFRESRFTRLIEKFLISREDIDIERSIAVSLGPDTEFCFIHVLRGEELANLVRCLEELSIVEDMNIAKEWGQMKTPTIVLRLKKGYICSSLAPWSEKYLIGASDGAITGQHFLEGMMGLYGEGVRSGMEIHARIEDILPTALHALRLPIPDSSDGRPLVEFFEEGWIKEEIKTISKERIISISKICKLRGRLRAEAESKVTDMPIGFFT